MATKKPTKEEKQQAADLAKLEAMVQRVDSEATKTPYAHGVLKSEPEQEFGRRLQELRESRDMTQSQLAERTKEHDSTGKGLSRSVISLYESGTNRPGLRELRILSEVFRTNPAYLIYGTPDPFDSFMERQRNGFYRTSNPEFLAIATYAFSNLHHHHRESILDLMQGLILGWGKQSVFERTDEANAYFLKAADELREVLAARDKKD